MRLTFAALALLLVHGAATASGYQNWRFGMTADEIKTVAGPSRYDDFKNGDVGAGDFPFEGGTAKVSFYLKDGRMERVMLIAYHGDDAAQARAAWLKAYAHLAKTCGKVESLSAGDGAQSQASAMAAFDRAHAGLEQGKQRHQMGCLTMPADKAIWVSASRISDNQLMVAVNYAQR